MSEALAIGIKFGVIDLLSRGVGKIGQNIHGMTEGAQRDFKKMNRAFRATMMMGVATAALANKLKPAIGAAGNLQASLLGVRAELMGGSKDAGLLTGNIAKIKGSAFSIQAWTPNDMVEMMNTAKALIKSGAKVKDIIGKGGALAAAAALGVENGIDPASAGKALITVGTPFNIDSSKFMALANDITKSAAAGPLSAIDIMNAAAKAGGTMASMHRSVNELTTLAAMMSFTGLRGEVAGSSINRFFVELANKKKKGNKVFLDKKGNVKSIEEIIAVLRTSLNGKSDSDVSTALTEAFGEEGMRVAKALLNEQKGSWESIVKAKKEAANLEDKIAVKMAGYNAQLTALKGTSSSVIADLYQPALVPLTAILKGMNEFWTLLGKISMRNGAFGQAVSGASLGAVGIGGAATVGLGVAGTIYARKMLKGVGGFKGLRGMIGNTAGGLMAGKAVEAATGVKPVFVTNWPSSMVTRGGFGKFKSAKTAGSSGVGAAAGGVGAAVSGKLGGILAKGKNLFTAGRAALLAPLALGAGTVAAGLAAGAAGAAVGTAMSFGIDKLVQAITDNKSQSLGEQIYKWLHDSEPIKNEINIGVNVDKDGRQQVVVEGNSSTVVNPYAYSRGSW